MRQYEFNTNHPEIKRHELPITGTFFGWWEDDGGNWGPIFKGNFRTFSEAVKAYESR